MPPVRRLLGPLITLGLIACADDPTAPTGDATSTPPATAHETLTADGGQIEIQTAEGSRVTFAFPEGALRSREEISLTALETSGDVWLQVVVEPAGIALDQPVTITVHVPETVPLDESTSLHFGAPDEPFFITTEVDLDARTLTASLAVLGFPDAVAARNDPVAADDGAATLGASAAVCEARAAAAQGALDIFLAVGDYARALQYFDAYTALAEADSCAVDYEAFVQTARPVVCDGYAGAKLAAQSIAVDDFETLYDVVGSLIYWFGEATVMVADCVDEDEFFSLLAAKFDQFLVFYNPQLQGIDPNDIALFQKLRDEARDVYRLYIEATQLALTDAAATLKSERFDPLLQAIRSVAYARCRSHDDHYFLSKVTWTGFWSGQDVLPTGREPFDPADRSGRLATGVSPGLPFSDEEIFADIQYCATCLTLKSLDDAGAELGQLTLSGGDSPGEAATSGGLTVDPSGRLVLSGEVRRLVCFPPGVNAGDYLDISIDGTSVATVPGAEDPDLLHQDITLEIAQLFETLGGNDPEPGETYTMEIHRHRTDCSDALFGTSPFKLFEVDLTIADDASYDAIDIEITEWTEAATSDDVYLVFTASYLQNGSIVAPAAGIDVEIEVQGGSASALEGVTDEVGSFATSVYLAADLVHVTIQVGDGTLEASEGLTTRRAIVVPLENGADIRARAWGDGGPGEPCNDHEFQFAETDDFDGYAPIALHKSCGAESEAASSVNLALEYDSAGDLHLIKGKGAATAQGNTQTYAWSNADFTFQVVRPVEAHMVASLVVAGDTYGARFGLQGAGTTLFAWDHEEGSTTIDDTVVLEPGSYRVTAHYRADGGRGASGSGDNFDYTLTLTAAP